MEENQVVRSGSRAKRKMRLKLLLQKGGFHWLSEQTKLEKKKSVAHR